MLGTFVYFVNAVFNLIATPCRHLLSMLRQHSLNPQALQLNQHGTVESGLPDMDGLWGSSGLAKLGPTWLPS